MFPWGSDGQLGASVDRDMQMRISGGAIGSAGNDYRDPQKADTATNRENYGPSFPKYSSTNALFRKSNNTLSISSVLGI